MRPPLVKHLYLLLLGSVTTIGLSFLQLPNSALAIDSESESIEFQFKKLSSDLSDITQQIKSSEKISSESGLGPQILDAESAYTRAIEAFKASDWVSSINEVNTYNSLVQKPNSEKLLNALFILGRSYEARGQYSSAAKTYSRYLATYTTNPRGDLENLTEVFERLAMLASHEGVTAQLEMKNFLSAISTMNHPQGIAEELRYLSAVVSSKVGMKNMAENWLGIVEKDANSPQTRARAKYYKALLAMAKRKWTDASEELESVLKITGISQKTILNTTLTLARTRIKEGKFNLALDAYQSIPESSDLHRESGLERIFLMMRMGKDQDANLAAQQWLKLYSEHPDSLQIRTVSTWLELRAGNLKTAKELLEQSEKTLLSIQKSLREDFDATRFTHDMAIKLASLTRGQVVPSSVHQDILNMYRRIAELHMRLLEVDGIERSIIDGLAKSNLSTMQPATINRGDQLNTFAGKIMEIGSQGIHVEKLRLGNRLTPIDRKKLESSLKRRENLFRTAAKLRRSHERWNSWQATALQLEKLSRNWDRLNDLSSQLNHIGDQGSNPTEISAAQSRIQDARSDFLNTLKNIRIEQAKNAVAQSPITEYQILTAEYCSLIADEANIINAYPPDDKVLLDHLDDTDSQVVWDKWRKSSNVIQQAFDGLKMKASQDISSTLKNLEQVNKSREFLAGEIIRSNEILKTYGGENLSIILAHYEHGIGQRLAKQYKWSADIDYLTYSQLKDSQDADKKRHELELQIIRDNLDATAEEGSAQWRR